MRRSNVFCRWAIGVLLIAALTGLAAAWRWSPLADRIDPEQLARSLERISDSDWALVSIPLGFAVASVVGVPVTALIVAVSLVFDGWAAVSYALLGAVAGAVTTFGLGRILGRDLVRRLAGRRIGRLGRSLGRHGLVAVITLRIVPVAPFSLVNLFMGASRIRLHHFVIGTIIGMLPGILAITVFVDRVRAAIADTSAESWLVAACAGLALAAGLLLLRRLLAHRAGAGPDGAEARNH